MMNRLEILPDASHVREYRQSEWKTLLTAAGFQIEFVELYTKHRPLTSLTDRVSHKNVTQIHALITRMTPEEKAMLNLASINGD